MRSLEALHKAIRTTEEIQSIVRTMKVMAAVSIRQYERAVESLVDYCRTVDLGMQAVVRNNPLMVDRQRDYKLRGRAAIIFGSDQGLCGRFNETLSDLVDNDLNSWGGSSQALHILTVGSRISAALEAQDHRVAECIQVPGSVNGISANVGQILIKISTWRNEGVEEIKLYFNEHRVGAAHCPRVTDLMPVRYARFNKLKKQPWPSRALPLYTMPDEQLMATLVRQYLFISIFRASAESLASEHASRLISMQIAEKNIKERLENLGSEFRQQRQNSITEELLDVVAASEMLKGS